MFQYYIENVSLVKTGKSFSVSISGWAFDEDSKITISVGVPISCKQNTKIAVFARGDVHKHFKNLPNSLMSGFSVEFYEINRKILSVSLNFINEKNEIVHTEIVKIAEKIKDLFPRFFSARNLQKVVCKLKEIGLLATVKLVIKKIKSSPDTRAFSGISPYVFFEDKYIYEGVNKYNICVIINAAIPDITVSQVSYTIKSLDEQYVDKMIILCHSDIKCAISSQVEYSVITEIKETNGDLHTPRSVLNLFSEEQYDGFFTVVDAGDTFAPATLDRIFEALEITEKFVVTGNEDRQLGNKFIAPIYKSDLIAVDRNVDIILRKSIVIHQSKLQRYLRGELTTNDIALINHVIYHYAIRDDFNKTNAVKAIAFYLPQFHTFPENDEWWGKGFTEWTNTRRGVSAFEGHYQPHEPGELGYYDLVNDPSIQFKQIALAREYGVYGFCYYYYWFNGKKLMEKPLERLIGDSRLDLPFCICWANETWSRRWDGQESEILIKQEHSDASDRQFIEDIIPILRDSRYITICGAPLLIIYRAELFDDFSRTVSVWKKICKEHGIENLHVSVVQSFGINNPDRYGADSAIEFPPHGVVTANISQTMTNLDKDFNGNIYSYTDVVSRMSNMRPPEYKLFRGIMLGWDNTARRQKSANVFTNSDTSSYYEWLCSLVNYTGTFLDKEEQIVFINAWNEWAEGTHLEPDKKNGRLYLEATKKALRINF